MIKLFFTTALLMYSLTLTFILWSYIHRASFTDGYIRATLVSEFIFYGITSCCNLIMFIIYIMITAFSSTLLFLIPIAIIIGILTGYLMIMVMEKEINKMEYIKCDFLHLVSILCFISLIVFL